MRTASCLLASLLTVSAAHAASSATTATDNVKARLIGETSSIAPGESAWVALELTIRDGWHTYWMNPGDSGQATRIEWTLPPGVTAGPIVWPTPHRFEIPPLVNYGYAHHVLHLVELKAAPDLKPAGVLALAGKASWLVCADVCIPESANLSLSMPVTAQPGAPDAAVAPLFAAARAELPRPQPAKVTAQIRGGTMLLELGTGWSAVLPQPAQLAFYPLGEGSIEYAAPQTLTRRADGTLELAMKVGYQPAQAGPVRGVLLASAGGDAKALPFELAAELTGIVNSTAPPPRFAPGAAGAQGAAAGAGGPLVKAAGGTAGSAADAAPPSIALLAFFAVLGGLVLNLMPCVFPVLSIKAIGLVEQAKKHPAAVRRKGLVFTAGVLASMLCLAAILLALRAGGEQIGWGFQLQSPLFVTLMIYLLLGVGLNLSGVFEVGGGLAGVGDSLTQGDGDRASFFTGVLTTLVATPCTAPFMAAAVGAALTQSPLVALVIFTALGLGLALPFLVLCLAPWTRRALPKPGPWMDTLKQVFAFPMYASAAWLLWVLAQQTSSVGLAAALAGAILIALAGWAYQKSRWSSGGGRAAALVTASLALVLALFLPVRVAQTAAAAPASTARAAFGEATPASSAGGGAPASAGTGRATAGSDDWQPYDAARLAELAAAGRPLLVNFTASWCLTCLVNERNAFGDAAVQAVFRGKGVTLMKGDWTNRDPAITQALAEFGRAGVPLYVAYNSKPGVSAPRVLPQLLTARIVEDEFGDLPDRSAK